MQIKHLGLQHLDYLTDDFSIWQHTEEKEINRAEGYAVDDAARALLLAIQINDLKKAQTYLNFLERACSGPEIYNFFTADRQPVHHRPPSDDALGEVYWALGACKAKGFAADQVGYLASSLAPRIKSFRYIRSRAYALLGALVIDRTLAATLLTGLKTEYLQNTSPEWPWIEPILSYGNAIFPLAFITAGQGLQDKEALEQGLTMLDFLNTETKINGVPMAIGCNGWYPRGGQKAHYDQQPIDPAYQVLANIQAYKQTGKTKYLKEAHLYMEWFWGNNLRKLSLISEDDQAVHDGLHEKGINQNRGAENIVCYLLAQEAFFAAKPASV